MMNEYKVLTTGNADFPFNVQLWTSIDGTDFYYTGQGKFCKDMSTVMTYVRENNQATHDSLRMQRVEEVEQ